MTSTDPSQIKVTFEAMDTAASDAESAASKIQGQLEQLKAELAPLVASWTGEAATDYQARQKLWDTSADELLMGYSGRSPPRCAPRTT